MHPETKGQEDTVTSAGKIIGDETNGSSLFSYAYHRESGRSPIKPVVG